MLFRSPGMTLLTAGGTGTLTANSVVQGYIPGTGTFSGSMGYVGSYLLSQSSTVGSGTITAAYATQQAVALPQGQLGTVNIWNPQALLGRVLQYTAAASATATTATSNGSTSTAHDSMMPIAGLMPIMLMQMSEGVIGGVGSGLYSMMVFVVLAVFIGGLMVGRTPEYVGKKIEAREVKLAVLAIAVLPLCILGGTAISSVMADGLAGPLNKGPHGFSEILYAFASATGNNGSAFAGLTAGTDRKSTRLNSSHT